MSQHLVPQLFPFPLPGLLRKCFAGPGHIFCFFLGRRKALLPYPSARILPGQHSLGGRRGYGPSTQAPGTLLPQEGPLGGSGRSLPTGCWPQGQVATEQAGVQPEDRGTSPLHPLLNKQEFFRYSSLRKTKLFPFSLASGLRCSSTRAIIRRGFASPGRDSG